MACGQSTVSQGRFSNSLFTAAIAYPITLAEAKDHLRVGGDPHPDDNYIEALILAATQATENITRRSFINQTWNTILDHFPWTGQVIELHDISPVQSITSITYIDEAGTTQTLSTDVYDLDPFSAPARLYEKDGQSWPSTLNTRNAVTIQSVAGYGVDGSSVPDPIKQAIKIMIEGLYEHRSVVEPGINIQLVPGQIAYEALLANYRVM